MGPNAEDDPTDPMDPSQGELVDPSVVAMIGMQFMEMDPGNYSYPDNEVPWEPEEGEGDPCSCSTTGGLELYIC